MDGWKMFEKNNPFGLKILLHIKDIEICLAYVL